jgi:MFS family permease
MIVSSLFGFFSAALQMNPVIMVDLLGVENLSLALGYVMIFRGIGILSGPPTAGAVYDATNSYDIAFYLAGGFIIFSCMILTVAAIFQKPKPKKCRKNPDAGKMESESSLTKSLIQPIDQLVPSN